jgi:hypothetical protein
MLLDDPRAERQIKDYQRCSSRMAPMRGALPKTAFFRSLLDDSDLL